jgi:hypothetical protein
MEQPVSYRQVTQPPAECSITSDRHDAARAVPARVREDGLICSSCLKNKFFKSEFPQKYMRKYVHVIMNFSFSRLLRFFGDVILMHHSQGYLLNYFVLKCGKDLLLHYKQGK